MLPDIDPPQEKSDTSALHSVEITPDKLPVVASHLYRQGKFEKAIVFYKLCLSHKPDDAFAWSGLGSTLRQLKHYDSALCCHRRAYFISPDDLSIKGNLANLLKDMHLYDESLTLHKDIVEQQPDSIQALLNYACALREAGKFSEALVPLDHAKRLQPDNQRIEWERAQNLLYLDYSPEAWQAYESRWHIGEIKKYPFKCPQWQGEPLDDKHIAVYAEQGYGDTILAARYLPLMKSGGACITLICKPELQRLFAGIGVDHLVAPNAISGDEMFDYALPLMSVMKVYGATKSTIPPPLKLIVPDECKKKFSGLKKNTSSKFKIGVAWSGSLTFKNNQNRSIALADLLFLSEIPDVQLYSLQKGPAAEQLYQAHADSFIVDLGKQCNDFAETAAVIEQMDVIVSVDTSIVHLAGSLGKLVINLLNKVPYWLYSMEGDSTEWYPSMTLIRQEEYGGWNSVFEKLNKLIINKFSEK